MTLAARDALCLDEVWWLVSPGNPLKPAAGMAPFAARFASARAMARHAPIRATAIESRMGTRYTVDTVRALVRRYPQRRFIWIMGADIIGEFHHWRDWRQLARLVPIAIMVRPGYMGMAVASPATAWLRRYVRPLGHCHDWTMRSVPAVVLLHMSPDPSSATALRRLHPGWAHRFPETPATRAAMNRRLP